MSQVSEISESKKWASVRERLPPFSGYRPERTDAWLEAVKTRLSDCPAYREFWVDAARACLVGHAETVMADYFGSNWDEFAAKLRNHLNPDIAKVDIYRSISDGSRYSTGTIQAALDLAVSDHSLIGAHSAMAILIAIQRRLPASVLDAISFSAMDEFSETISKVRTAADKAAALSDRESAWARLSSVQVFTASTTVPPTPDNGSKPSRSGMRRKSGKARQAALVQEIERLRRLLSASGVEDKDFH